MRLLGQVRTKAFVGRREDSTRKYCNLHRNLFKLIVGTHRAGIPLNKFELVKLCSLLLLYSSGSIIGRLLNLENSHYLKSINMEKKNYTMNLAYFF